MQSNKRNVLRSTDRYLLNISRNFLKKSKNKNFIFFARKIIRDSAGARYSPNSVSKMVSFIKAILVLSWLSFVINIILIILYIVKLHQNIILYVIILLINICFIIYCNKILRSSEDYVKIQIILFYF